MDYREQAFKKKFADAATYLDVEPEQLMSFKEPRGTEANRLRRA